MVSLYFNGTFKFFGLILLMSLFFALPIRAQISNDSLATSLDSLLNMEVERIEYTQSASRYFQFSADAPSSVSIINKTKLQNYGYNSLDELFNSQKGFYITNDRNYDYLGVRGFSRPTDYNNRILFLINGHRLNDGFYNAAYFGNETGLDVFNYDQVEIVRGPGSALFGSSAMFATINVTTVKNITGIIPSIKVSYGSFNTQRLSLNWGIEPIEGMHIYLNGNLSTRAGEKNIYYPEFDSEETNNGIAENLDNSKNYGFAGGMEYGDFKLAFYSSYSRKDVPTAAWENDFNALQQSIDEFQFVEAGYETAITSYIKSTSKIYYDRYTYQGFYTYSELPETESNNVDSYGAENHFIIDISKNNRVLFGIEYKNITRANYKYNLSDQPESVYINKPHSIFSFYIQNDWQINPYLAVYLGVRGDKYSSLSAEYSPRIGLVYTPDLNNSLKLVYNKAFRNPSVYESDYFDPILNYVENPHLKSERLRMVELIWEYMINKNVSTSLSVYQYDVTNLIDQNVNQEGSIQFQNIGSSKARGFEAEVLFTLDNNISGFCNYSYQLARGDNDKLLSNSPENMFKAGLSCESFKLGNLYAEFIFNSRRYTIHDNTTDHISVFNISYTTPNLLNKIKLGVSVKNAFNGIIEYPGGFEHIQNVIKGYSRSINLSLFIN